METLGLKNTELNNETNEKLEIKWRQVTTSTDSFGNELKGSKFETRVVTKQINPKKNYNPHIPSEYTYDNIYITEILGTDDDLKKAEVYLGIRDSFTPISDNTTKSINELLGIRNISENIEGLSEEGLKKITESVIKKVKENGADYYGWKNSPEIGEDGEFVQEQGWGDQAEKVGLSKEEAKKIYDEKLNGAYGERFVMSLGMLSSLMKNGYNIRFVQFQEEKGVPFDANGWTVMVIEGMPMFHVSPDDLDAEGLGEYVEILDDNEAPDVSWKGTNKVGEFEALLKGAVEKGLDLVEIAKKGSE